MGEDDTEKWDFAKVATFCATGVATLAIMTSTHLDVRASFRSIKVVIRKATEGSRKASLKRKSKKNY